ncbi:hypothetical protein vBSlqSZDD2_23 [Serratia phage vB_SlqS_ZDD2]|nr:hypothetical protein vBSlqSZDD2_23 [Serratia phage vB_SlqS_ZDD2]
MIIVDAKTGLQDPDQNLAYSRISAVQVSQNIGQAMAAAYLGYNIVDHYDHDKPAVRQVGGTHYQRDYPDLIQRTKMDSTPEQFRAIMLFQAKRYLERIDRKDNSLQDIEKAIDYLNYVKESYQDEIHQQ